MAKNRPNVIPIIEDARHPQKYRMLVPMVDAIFADVAQPDQVNFRLLRRSCFILGTSTLSGLAVSKEHLLSVGSALYGKSVLLVSQSV